ncbi:hypothetical protein SD37_09215 [Amycolatopsis orientalis]|uniref:Uncharacterized protein n=1 Tax=Amycolatopsis orientalis TaxID=31958 RepID=A0A193BUC2_AMYOR|nr:hypothetical protein SD37_09215 [Amycolatopsis orientalis]
MGAQPTPGLFEGVEDLVLGDGLIDAALEDALSAAAGERDRFVRREQRDVRPLEFPLDRQALEGSACHAADAFADHYVERSCAARRLVEQVRDSACAWDGDVEAVVVRPLPPVPEFHAAGLDVVEVRDDDPRVRDRRLAVGQLPKHRLARVLQVFCGRSPQERDAYFVAEQGGGHA